jgi:hypothetical protein
MKESELPPPPSHACPNENRPETKEVPKGQERNAIGSAKPRPVAVCTRCGMVSYATQFINGQCAQVVAGKRCVGVNGSALSADDWKQCSACEGAGDKGTTRCGQCDGAGWLYTRGKG